MPFNSNPIVLDDSKEVDVFAYVLQFYISPSSPTSVPSLSLIPSLVSDIKQSGLSNVCYKCPMLKNGVDPDTAAQLPSQG